MPTVRNLDPLGIDEPVSKIVQRGEPTLSTVQSGTAAPFPGPDEQFEVASVKPNNSGQAAWDLDDSPGPIVGTNLVLRDLRNERSTVGCAV